MSLVAKLLGEDTRIHRATVVVTIEGTDPTIVTNLAISATREMREFGRGQEEYDRTSGTQFANLKINVVGMDDPKANSDIQRAFGDDKIGYPVKPIL